MPVVNKLTGTPCERPISLSSDTNETMPAWKKQLYKRQPFPDNYSGGDECFLMELRKNVSAVKYSFGSAVGGACHLMLHLNFVLLYFLLFEAIYAKSVQSDVVLWSFVAASTIAYGLYQVGFHRPEKWAIQEHILVFLTLLLFGYALTPIIRTLTTTISTDTIYALAIFFAVFSCIFHDYGIKAPIVSVPVSVSCGLCSSVLLISRLSDSESAFLLLSISFSLHSLLPTFQNALMLKIPAIECLICVVLSGICCYALVFFDPVLTILWAILVVFVVVLCPSLLISLQPRKRTIHGPWDEAVPARSASELLK
ncbi:unnamed protein product, partial [Mesorhabditis spiculigera]